MPTHITARLAWHNDGWNGAICREPVRNTYCVGCKSFPGDVIARERALDIEKANAGKPGHAVKGYVAPCCYSYNAFGLEEAPAASNPPDFFYGGAERREWTLLPATVSVWPYEAMYAEEVKAGGFLDNDKRRALTLEFFRPIVEDCGNNLIFYYANYSNPLSEDEDQKYVLIGVSRIKKIGEEIFYDNVKPNIAEKYAGGMVWARDIGACYPDEGLRLPFHKYLDDLDQLESIAVYPENPFLCKYGSKHVSDDEAIGLLEQFLDKVRYLKQIGDDTEDWEARETWLLKTIAELWSSRGLYPGLLKALEASGATSLIDGVKAIIALDGHQKAHADAFEAIESAQPTSLTAGLDAAERKRIARNWQLLPEASRNLLRDVLPRFELSAETMTAIASDERETSGLSVTADEIAENPYLISEMYCGAVDAERIPWSSIDRGVLPSPDVGGKPLAGVDYNDERRFRSLCVEHLRREQNHTFRFATDILAEITERMDRLPSWKQASFSSRYFDVDAEFLSKAITQVKVDAGLLIYLKSVYEDEQSVCSCLSNLVSRPEIDLRRPVSSSDWLTWIKKSDSVLAEKGGEEYQKAVNAQAELCERLFRCPLSVVTGAAGTGKTTVIEALIRAVRKSEGEGASVLVLAPTGKATDRAREVFEKAALPSVATVTVHSLLAAGGWLNDNLTLKRKGGKRSAVGTIVLDEASMLDLELAACLFRAIDWQQVRRLILVGDAGQLPPIGRGRVFADVNKWLASIYPESLGRLRHNLRQMLNRVQGNGSSILALSELFVMEDDDKSKSDENSSTRPDQELLIERIHAGGKIDHDLDVVYWDDPERLSALLIQSIESKMRTGQEDDRKPYKVWQEALQTDPTLFQVLTPHRGEMHGVEALNEACQARTSAALIGRIGALDGITLSDKVIQIRNRPKSNPIWAYDKQQRATVKVEAFNGEIGVVQPIGFDSKKLWQTVKTGFGPRLKRFAVQYSRRPGVTIGYGKDVPHGGSYKRNESVEENLELAYAISIHKAQGSEFGHTFVILPASDRRPISAELVYTALTRANRHCTLFLERDVRSLLDARRRENAQTPQINSSLFSLHIANPNLVNRRSWYETGKIHESLSGDMLRSKSEVIIANLLHERQIPFLYEMPLYAGDGTLKLPDFTISWNGRTHYWEHLGRLDLAEYAKDWEIKRAWYDKWFPGQLITTQEGSHLSKDAHQTIETVLIGLR